MRNRQSKHNHKCKVNKTMCIFFCTLNYDSIISVKGLFPNVKINGFIFWSNSDTT